MSDLGSQEQRTLRVFISYSRKDSYFAHDLVAGLRAAGFEPFVDRQDIAPGEDWEARLGKLIQSSDCIVFVLSPDSIASNRCIWELNHAETLSRRIVPVVCRSVESEQIPKKIAQLNYVFFNQQNTFGASLLALTMALRTDVTWIRNHTQVSDAALQWSENNRVESYLYRGKQLEMASLLLNSKPIYAPEPTLLTRDFIRASQENEQEKNSKERKALEQIRNAQFERQNALDREQQALKNAGEAIQRRQYALSAVAVLLGFIGFGLFVIVNRQYVMQEVFRLAYIRVHTISEQRSINARAGTAFRECTQSAGESMGDIRQSEIYSAVCPDMVVVPNGQFSMGENNTALGSYSIPKHLVTISNSFAMSRFEVTAEQWEKCVIFGNCVQAGGRGNEPVTSVSWLDAKQYVEWLSLMTGKEYRLPTETEWEYAARAGRPSLYSWGDSLRVDGLPMANCGSCGSNWDRKAAPVGRFQPNAYGLYDMHGNVWEWVEDSWHDDYTGAPDKSEAWVTGGDASLRVIRGGSYVSDPEVLRTVGRNNSPIGVREFNVGFRVARTLND